MPAASREFFEFAVVADQRIRRTIVAKPRFCFALEFGDDPQGKHLTELYAPLVERVDVPDGTLGKDTVLIESDELAERCRGQPLQEDRVGRPITLERTVRHEPVGRALGMNFLWSLTKSERFALRENVGEQHVMLLTQRVQRLAEGDEVAGDMPSSLMDQLIKRVLAPRTAFAGARRGLRRNGL